MGLYKPTDQSGQPLNVIYAEDVGQLVDVLTGQRDGGALSLLPQVPNPSQAPTVALSSGSVTGTGYQWGFYWITGVQDGTGAAHVSGRTLAGTLSSAQALSSQEATVSLPNAITIPTGVIGWGVVRNKSAGATWYEVPGAEQFLTLAGAMPGSFVDNTADSSLVTAAPPANTTGTSGGWASVKLWDSTEAGASFPAASISTPTLPQTFKHLRIVLSLSSQASGGSDGLWLRVNGHGSSYSWSYTYFYASTISGSNSDSDTAMYVGILPGQTYSASRGVYTIAIPHYASASSQRGLTAFGMSPQDHSYTVIGGGHYGANEAVSTITFGCAYGFEAGRITIYGEN